MRGSPPLIASTAILMATVQLKDAGSIIAGNLEWLGFTPPEALKTGAADSVIFWSGVILFLVWAALLYLNREKQPALVHVTALEELDAKRALREDWAREKDRPLKSLFAVFTLNDEISPDDLGEMAGMIAICLPEQQCLYFGVGQSPDKRGLQTEVWTYPCNPTHREKPQWIDRFTITGFTKLDRLEAGAVMSAPFTSVGDLDDGIVLIKATPRLIERLSKVSIIANGYVAFSKEITEIAEWRIPPKYPPGVRFDVDERDGWADFLRDFQLGVAIMKSGTRASPPEQRAVIDLSTTPQRIVLSTPDAKRVADGTTTYMRCSLPENERGWLPRL